MRFDGRMGSEPITVSIRREVDPDRIAEATVWVQTGVNLANRISAPFNRPTARAQPSIAQHPRTQIAVERPTSGLSAVSAAGGSANSSNPG